MKPDLMPDCENCNAYFWGGCSGDTVEDRQASASEDLSCGMFYPADLDLGPEYSF